MKTSLMTRNRGQVYSVGNYLMTGKVLGKGHFARVEEATHRIIGKKVAIKIIDLTCIKEEYARRNLHREPTVMARLRHPCIAALYETMMHGPRLYVVMEAAGGGDLCALVLGARGASGGTRGLPEARARGLAAQLVSAVRHMHARGVVHRDLKMENIMLDSSKMFIKIVDFGLSNLWNSVGGLHTPCGSLEYAAPELFRDTRRYGPELDLWSIGVIVYGMVTGSLPFVGSGGTGAGADGEGRSRPQLRAAIARGFSRKHRAALVAFSPECRAFIQQLLEPNVENRMKIEEGARHRWLKRPGMKMRTHPLGDVDLKTNREIYKQMSDLCGTGVVDIVSQIKANPYGSVAGMYNIKAHLSQLNALPNTDPLWSTTLETRPLSPPEYKPHKPSATLVRPLSSYESKVEKHDVISKPSPPPHMMRPVKPYKAFENGDCLSDRPSTTPSVSNGLHVDRPHIDRPHIDRPYIDRTHIDRPHIDRPHVDRPYIDKPNIDRPQLERPKVSIVKMDKPENPRLAQPYNSMIRPVRSKPIYKVCDNGDCVESRLPSIAEHRKLDDGRWPRIRDAKPSEDERRKLTTCPARVDRRAEFYRRAGDAVPKYENWRAHGTASSVTPPARILFQSNATTIKRASLGNITSPHSSANSYCKSERAMPVGWYSTRSANKESTAPSLQRLRRTAPIK